MTKGATAEGSEHDEEGSCRRSKLQRVGGEAAGVECPVLRGVDTPMAPELYMNSLMCLCDKPIWYTPSQLEWIFTPGQPFQAIAASTLQTHR